MSDLTKGIIKKTVLREGYARSKGIRLEANIEDVLEAKVEAILDAGLERAKANGRQTIKAHDL